MTTALNPVFQGSPRGGHTLSVRDDGLADAQTIEAHQHGQSGMVAVESLGSEQEPASSPRSMPRPSLRARDCRWVSRVRDAFRHLRRPTSPGSIPSAVGALHDVPMH
jgi:hypothetical protein